jgi:hypothetical protein
MAMEGVSPGPAAPRFDRVRRAVHTLFPEARRRERRRRLLYALLMLLVAAVAIALVQRGDSSEGGGLFPTRLARVTVRSVALPAVDHFSSVAAIDGRLIVSGGPQGSLAVSAAETSLVGGRAAGTCAAATVDPRTLTIGPVAHANCGDPALYGEHILPIAYGLPRSTFAGTSAVDVRIARSDPAARDGYTLGPVVTTYPQCSDCQIAWIIASGSLWLYNPFPGNRPQGSGVLLRISTHTGAVLERWTMPEIVRALLAADADGLWLSPSIESGTPGRLSPAQRISYFSLYHVSPGLAVPQRVLTERGGYARWLTATRHTASADIDNGRGFSVVWTFTDDSAPVHGHPLNDNLIGTEVGTFGPTVAGNTTIGFFTVLLGNGTERVIRIDPGARHEQQITTIRSRNTSIDDGAPRGVTLGGSFFFLDPTADPTHGSTRLHRITSP